jgi:hypothetical protein
VILDGSVTYQEKTNFFFKSLNFSKASKNVKIDLFIDFYVTKSLVIDSDRDFRDEILKEYNLNDNELSDYMSFKVSVRVSV